MELQRLTQYSEGSGCGCKIAPAVLTEIIAKSGINSFSDPLLLVGNESMDDAAAYDLGDGNALISTVDFFTAIVDDPFDYGCIAAANSISDIYAMGGKPLFANAVLSWPVDKLPPEMAAKVLEGAKSVCARAGILLAGGHSIAGKEPIFGLSVNGICKSKNIKRNNTAKKGDILYLTKPLGAGVLATAIKRDKITAEHYQKFIQITSTLNQFGTLAGEMMGVHAMTDVTGFGLLGHLIEMCEGSGLSALVDLKKIPVIEGIQTYIDQYIFPDNVWKNWNACEQKTGGINGMEMVILCDPQTSGGLLIAVDPGEKDIFEQKLKETGTDFFVIGEMTEMGEKAVMIYGETN